MNIGVGWKKQSKGGKDYISCILQSPFLPGGEVRFAIFRVDEKKSDKSPDYNIVWGGIIKPKTGEGADVPPPPGDDDIPF